jgi:hypothetical protein
MASNFPPGCSIRDIPGNRPEDEAQEAAYEQLCEELEVAGIVHADKVDEEWHDHLVQFIMRKMGDAYGEGYQQAQADEAEAKYLAESEALAKEYWEYCEQHTKGDQKC